MVQLLLAKENVDPNSEDNDSRTPVSLAALYGHRGAVKLLLANVDTESNHNNNWPNVAFFGQSSRSMR